MPVSKKEWAFYYEALRRGDYEMDEGEFWHIHDKVLKELNERKAKKVGKFGKGGSNPPY